MRAGEWTLRSRRVVTPSAVRPADVLIRGETIVAISDHEAGDAEGVILDLGDRIVLPGLVGIRREDAEGCRADWFEAATRECASMGMTTLLALPDHSEERTDVAPGSPDPSEVRIGMIRVDCGLVLPLIDEHSRQIESRLEAGFLGIEAFAAEGHARDSLQVAEAHLAEVMPALANVGRPLFVELGRFSLNDGSSTPRPTTGNSQGLRGDVVCDLLIHLCRQTRCRLHVLHSSNPEVRLRIAEARAAGLPISIGPLAPVCPDGTEELSEAWSGACGAETGLVELARTFATDRAEAIGIGDRKGSIATGLDADFCVVALDPRPDRAPSRSKNPFPVEMTFLRGNLIFQGGRLVAHPRGSLILRGEQTEPIPDPRV